ncbi:germin-like protein 9-3 [Gossypium australe]|uniref:Germin-like protein 9-3 n=1 Tax=Gossypium australe TaxID=47621 RepID=A0A5B6VG74_9ROSI|nr:germin-like protein 9-3 [Gossypium australe]
MAEFPALKGQSVSYAVLQYLACSLNPRHTRPCATELFFLTYGRLEVGFIDSTNKLFTQIYSCSVAGTVSVPSTVLVTVVDDEKILAKCFRTDVDTIQKLKAGFALKA